jgi:putative colanic acid biosysnthesis UDP-glucose lipid carrier transferase
MSLYRKEAFGVQPAVVQFEPGTPVLVPSDDICVISLPVRLSRPANRCLKRLFDLGLSSIIILCLFPFLLPLIALLIWLDSVGPIFFLQKRNKIHGGVFTCMKFRTMEVFRTSDSQYRGSVETQITRVGKFLRQTHLDELPQLFNVWIGDMSLVGPRPYMICDNQRLEMLVPRYHLRHTVKPGITGLAQAAGLTGPMEDLAAVEERWKKDITYIHKWSLWLDVKILWATIRNIVSSKNLKIRMPAKNVQP